MRITIKIDSATADEVRALQQSVHAACRPDEIGGMSPLQVLPGCDSHSRTAVYAWGMGSAWDASTPPIPGAYGERMLRELFARLTDDDTDFPGFIQAEWLIIADACAYAARGDTERESALNTIAETIWKAYK